MCMHSVVHCCMFLHDISFKFPGFNSRRQQQRPKAQNKSQHHGSFPQRQRTLMSPMYAPGGKHPILPSALPDSFTSLRASSESTLLSPSPSPPSHISLNRTRTRFEGPNKAQRFDSRAKGPQDPPRRLRRPQTTVETLTTASIPPKQRAEDIEAAYDYVYSDDIDDDLTTMKSRFDPRPTGATVVATRPHPTMPDYEYAYYYEDGEGDYDYYQDLGRPISSPPPPRKPPRHSTKVKPQSHRHNLKSMYPSSPVPGPSKVFYRI